MLKKNILRVSFILFTFFFMLVPKPVLGLPLDVEVRTVPYTRDPLTYVTLSVGQLKRGKYLFSNACATCHVAGGTKPDPNVGLDIATLKKSVPRRDCVTCIVSFLRDPKTFDGRVDISELHPCIKRGDIWPKMRRLTEANLVEISGYVLFEVRVLGRRWGGGNFRLCII
jgi:photosystem II cytochrome c550